MPVKSTVAGAMMSFAICASPSTGASPVALFVTGRARKSRESLLESNSLGYGAALEELGKVETDCRDADWDGYGAAPVKADTVARAVHFLYALPPGMPRPTIGAEPDGHLTFEWYKSPRWTLSVSVSPDGNLYYSCLLGPASKFGTEPFWGQPPRSILELVPQVARG
jgi:hypothetical protein